MRTFKYLQSVQYTCTSAVQDVNKGMDEESQQKELMTAAMDAAVNLIQTYNSGLSTAAIRMRMNRVADDLHIAVE